MKTCVLALLMLVGSSPCWGADISINVPKMPITFPRVFPPYVKCFVKGKRMACYDKQGVKNLLAVWYRYELLETTVPIISKQRLLLHAADNQIKKLRKATAALRAAVAKRKEAKRKQQEQTAKNTRAKTLRNVLVVSALVVVSLATGALIGYLAKE